MCEKEGNDQGCCCCCGSYVGVIVFGILTAIGFFSALIQLISPSEQKNIDGSDMSEEQKEQTAMNNLVGTIIYGIEIVPFVLVLIW